MATLCRIAAAFAVRFLLAAAAATASLSFCTEQSDAVCSKTRQGNGVATYLHGYFFGLGACKRFLQSEYTSAGFAQLRGRRFASTHRNAVLLSRTRLLALAADNRIQRHAELLHFGQLVS